MLACALVGVLGCAPVEPRSVHASEQILLDHAPVVDELISAIRGCPTQERVATLDSALAARNAQLLR